MKRKKNKKMQKRRLLAQACALLLAVYLGSSLVMAQLEIATRRQQLLAIQNEVYRQQTNIMELTRILSSEDDSYIERIARDRLNYASPEERVFVDISGK